MKVPGFMKIRLEEMLLKWNGKKIVLSFLAETRKHGIAINLMELIVE